MNITARSRIFAASKHKDEILAAMKSPINQELLQQLNSIPEDVEVVNVESDVPSDDNFTSNEPEETSGKAPSKPHVGGVGSPAHFSSNPDFDDSEDVDIPEGDESTEVDLPDTDVEEPVEESTKVTASTYVDVPTVTKAVKMLPGSLNAREETAGATVAMLKGGSNQSSGNEIWIYYNTDIDVNDILDKVVSYVDNANFYYLEFNRVSRDENAIIFTVNWVSNYFRPEQLNVDEEA